MAFVAVDKDGEEIICDHKPLREPTDEDGFGYIVPTFWDAENRVELPPGSIAKLIGRELTWEDEPVELK